MIQLQDVSKVYQTGNGPVHALSGVSLTVEPGEFVAVQGPSGCGKSTLLTIVGGLGMPTSGSVSVAGEDVVRMSSAQRARFRAERIGFVFQMFHLLPYLTVVENVVVAARPGTEAAARTRAKELLGQFQLGHRLNHRPGELSTGECQRVAIARAMVNRPQLILADEPTGNLDSVSGQNICRLLRELCDQQGRTSVIVTHEPAVAVWARRVIVLRDGRTLSEFDTASFRDLHSLAAFYHDVVRTASAGEVAR
jgi:putative ABC transport system ATP-binding protein